MLPDAKIASLLRWKPHTQKKALAHSDTRKVGRREKKKKAGAGEAPVGIDGSAYLPPAVQVVSEILALLGLSRNARRQRGPLHPPPPGQRARTAGIRKSRLSVDEAFSKQTDSEGPHDVDAFSSVARVLSK